MSDRDQIPIACTLTPREAADQAASWAALGPMLRRCDSDDRGVTLWFDAAADATVAVIAQREALCCAFLSIRRSHEDGLTRLDINCDDPDGVAVARLIATQVSGSTEISSCDGC